SFAGDAAGEIWCLADEYGGTDGTRLVRLGNAGEAEGIWDTDAYGLEFADGLLYSLCYDGDGCFLRAMDTSGAEPEPRFELEAGDNCALAVTADGRLAVQDGTVIRLVDAESGAWGESFELGAYFSLASGAGDTDLFLTGGSSLYGFELESGERTKILSFMTAGVSSPYNVSAAGNESFLVAGDQEVGLCLLTPDGETGQTVTLTLALSGYDTDIRGDIARWNREHADIKIETLDYAIYDTDGSGEAGALRMATKIIAGNIPDIFVLNGLPSQSWATRGMLENLYPYIDADPELERSDFFENILTASEYNGALCELIPKFGIVTAAARSGTPGLSLSELDTVTAERIFGMDISRSQLLELLLEVNMDSFIDWESGSCRFDSELFTGLLELAALQPEEAVTGEGTAYNYEYEYDAREMLRSGRQLLYVYQMDSVNHTSALLDMFGEAYDFVGLPGGSAVRPYLRLGMAANSEHKAECWEFLRTFLVAECTSVSGLSLRRDVEEATRREYLNRMMDSELDMETLTNRAFALVESVDALCQTDVTILSIVLDEAAAFFAGDKSAEETAKNIQSRVSIYVAEQS
ncbi:MAG: hypothetical protein Q4B42_07185, partial [Oscillospiraceae bacterium]|nr:hypothetical protein [Oscillospiraceae bacterium]